MDRQELATSTNVLTILDVGVKACLWWTGTGSQSPSPAAMDRDAVDDLEKCIRDRTVCRWSRTCFYRLTRTSLNQSLGFQW